MAFEDMAVRVASSSVEAARKRKKKPVRRKKKPVRRKTAPARKRKRTSRPVKTDAILSPSTEYACQIELSMDATFEGNNVSKQQLLRKMKSELVSAIKESATRVAREFDLESKGVRVQPLKFECAVDDQSDLFDVE